MLTSLTTFFGLLPLLFERSAQADWLEPMAATLGIGVLFASLITLVLVPALAALLEDGIRLMAGLGALLETEPREVAPDGAPQIARAEAQPVASAAEAAHGLE